MPGSELYLDFSSGLDVSDNFDRIRDPSGTSVVWVNSFGLTFDSATRNQRFTASAGFTYEIGEYADDLDRDQGGVEAPFATIDYGIENRSTVFGLELSYVERDNGFDDIEITDADDIIVDQGTRSDFTVAADLTLGRDAPVTFTTDLRYVDTRFFDTTDPALDDEITYAVESVLSLNLTRTTSLFFAAEYEERDEDDEFDSFEVNTSASVGLSFATAYGLEGAVSFGYAVDEFEQTINGERVETRTDSPVASIDLSQDRPNGVVRAGLSQEVNDRGRRTRFSLGRALTFKRGELDATLGLSIADYDERLRGIGSISYQHDLPRGLLQLRFSQEITDDSDEDEDLFISTAGLDYTRPLTNISSLQLSIDLSASEAVDADEADTQRASLLLSYTRELTREWDFNAGYRHSTFRETDRSPIIENAVFARIERRFDVRP
ncbi:MAG: hypothetical protein AAGG09_12855 [Pseudomonadota bacterium]